jgi:WhiB family redox-sensing transcriptional regulator
MKYPQFDGTQACASVSTDLFFAPDVEEGQPIKPANYREAKAICASCAWRTPCLSWAISEPMVLGVWGGTSERERSRIRGASRVA